MIAPSRPLRARRSDGEGAAVRWFICAVVLLALTPRAFADDLDILRGTEPVGAATFPRWSGFYFGGQAGFSGADTDFSRATAPLLAYSLRGLAVEAEADPSSQPVLGKGTANVAGYGGFVGYNTQWQDAVLGLEVDYTHSPYSTGSSNSPFVDRIFSIGSNLTSVTEQGTGSMQVTDYASLRLRAGWIFGNNFLPYAFGGFAMGRGSYSLSTLVFGQQSSPPPPTTPSLPCAPSPGTCLDYSFPNAASGSVLMYGFSVGGGVDIALSTNLFIRGEVEYVEFPEVSGITVNIATGRVGAGLKF